MASNARYALAAVMASAVLSGSAALALGLSVDNAHVPDDIGRLLIVFQHVLTASIGAMIALMSGDPHDSDKPPAVSPRFALSVILAIALIGGGCALILGLSAGDAPSDSGTSRLLIMFEHIFTTSTGALIALVSRGSGKG